VRLAGIATQLASPESDPGQTCAQLDAFRRVLRDCEPILRDIAPRPVIHTANSSASLLYRDSIYDMVRVGLLAYGIDPLEGTKPPVAVAAAARAVAQAGVSGTGGDAIVPGGTRDPNPQSVSAIRSALQPAMRLSARLVQAKRLPAGSKISYGGTYTVPQETRVGVVSIGYGDGYPRHLSNRGEVLLAGARVPIIGVVCMDLFMVDLGPVLQARVGDVVTLIGKDGSEEITAGEIAALCQIPVHAVVSSIATRVTRVYSNSASSLPR
jgi:alanine racemase